MTTTPTKTILEKLRSPLVLIGAVLATCAALVTLAIPFVTRFGADQMVNFEFCPPRAEDPQQWEWYPQKREAFEVTADDGTILHGYFLPAEAEKPTGTVVILGHMSCADQMAWYAQQVVKTGFNAVLYDARAHGKSGGSVCSFGLHEAGDAKMIARHVKSTHPGPVFLWGTSMGAVVGAQALSGNTPFSGGVLFSPFSNLDAMIAVTLHARRVWWVPGLANDVRKRIREVIGVSASEVSPEKAAAEIRVPVLIVHGSMDVQIPVSQGRLVFDAIPDARKEFLELPEADHDDIVAMETPWGKKTLQRTLDFLKKAGSM